MRPLLLIFCSLIVIAGVFTVYLWFQPAPTLKTAKSITLAPRSQRPQTTQSMGGIGGGNNPWIRRFEQGELRSQFRGEQYQPQQGDNVHVTRPQAEFFSEDGQQRLRIEGATGTVVVPLSPEEKPGKMQSGVDFQPPTRGNLQDVKISMFQPADATEPMLVAEMNNAVFDNDTFRISTDSYVDSQGNTVPGDQVPVSLRGRDYDFDGRGMIIRWNERDQKLQLLEIRHGESLTVKNPTALTALKMKSDAAAPAPVVAPVATTAPVAATAPAPNTRAAIRAAAARRAKKKKPPAPAKPAPVVPGRGKIVRDASPTVYRASFEDAVRIFEADEQIISADVIHIDLLQESRDNSTTKPSAAPPVSPAATKPAGSARRNASPASPAMTQSTTKPAVNGPLIVRWTGRLRVAPLEGEPEPHLEPDKAAVEIVGSPLILTRDGSRAECGIATFNSADGSASLRASDAVAIVTMTDANGTKVVTPHLEFAEIAPGERFAILDGQSHAEIPVQGEDGKVEHVKATWATDCALRLIDDGKGNMAIEQAELLGDVRIEHPQLSLASDALELTFEQAPDAPKAPSAAPSTAPAKGPPVMLRDIVATGNVKCRVIDERQQNIEAQRLHVAMATSPAGKPYARLLEAEGDVRTTETGRKLLAGSLVAELAPSTRPATVPAERDALVGGGDVELVSLVARDKVQLETDEGARASADELTVSNVAGREEYRLVGQPSASVTDGKTTLSAPKIRFAPDEKIAEIIGPGTLHGTQPDDPKQTVDIAWGGGATVNGLTDWIEVTDKVSVSATQPDGTIITAISDTLRAQLAPAPTTAPAEQAAQATSQPTAKEKMDFLAGKQIGETTLSGHVEVKSELLAEDGSLARGLNLLAETVIFDRVTGRMRVPAAGQMLYRDHRPPDKTAEARKSEGPTLGSGRGSTAFKWNESLAYEQADGRAVMSGDVNVVHWPEQNDGQPFSIWSDTLTADLEPDPEATKDQLRLKSVNASGNVRVTSQRLNLDANELSYDPLNQVLTATADPDAPINFVDNQSGSSTTASEVHWNTATDQIRIKRLSGRVRR